MCIVAVKMEKTIAKEESEVDDPQPVDKDEFKVDLKDLDEGPIEIKEEPLDETEAQPSTSKKTDIKLEVKAECDIDSESCDSSSIDYNAIKEEPPDDDDDDEDVEMDEDDPDGDEELSNLGDVDMKFEASEETLQDGKGYSAVQSDTGFKCPLCHLGFTDLQLLKDHKNLHNGPLNFCQYCPFSTNLVLSFKRHIFRDHPEKFTDDYFKCNSCSYKSMMESLMKNHVVKHSFKEIECNQQVFSCSEEDCKFNTNSKKHLLIHIKELHAVFNCNDCYFKTRNINSLYIHIENLHNKKFKLRRVKCSYCSYQTYTLAYLKNHLITMHQTDRDMICPHCDYTTKLKENLEIHIKKHTKKKVLL